MNGAGQLYGVMGRFADAEGLLSAVRACRDEYEYQALEAYTPFPVPEISKLLSPGSDPLPLWALAGGLFGALSGFVIQSYSAVVNYPINVGGRPLFSWPAFLPATILLTLFWGAAGATLGMFWLSRLPKLYHPVFNVADFADASRDGFYLVIRSHDPAFSEAAVRRRLEQLGAATVSEVQS